MASKSNKNINSLKIKTNPSLKLNTRVKGSKEIQENEKENKEEDSFLTTSELDILHSTPTTPTTIYRDEIVKNQVYLKILKVIFRSRKNIPLQTL